MGTSVNFFVVLARRVEPLILMLIAEGRLVVMETLIVLSAATTYDAASLCRVLQRMRQRE